MSVELTKVSDSIPLRFSAYYGNVEATKALVERGASLNNANKFGATPLLLEARYDKIEVFHCLTELGADINISDTRLTLLFTMILFWILWKLSRFKHPFI